MLDEVINNPGSESLRKVDEYLALPDHPDHDFWRDDDKDEAFKDGSWKDDEGYEMFNAVIWKYRRIRAVAHPEPGDVYTYHEWKAGRSRGNGRYSPNLRHNYQHVDLESEFKDQGLQVIVKLASVELTPEKPEYEGGSWHLEVRRNSLRELCSKCPAQATTSYREHCRRISLTYFNTRE